ncbi:hypothetical protein HYO62_03920 [Aerococcaceae bacterium DSM 111022]|nr:hypothetical protein [Aerococcaceae bacterium DSM 111022]
MSTKITFWSGLDTIGANIISLEKNGFQLITDLGAYVGADIDALLDRNLTSDLYEAGLLPPMNGLYPEEQVKDLPLESFEQSDLKTAICLSHLHLDHLGSFGQISSEVPVYTLNQGANFYQNLKQHKLLPLYDVNWQGMESGVMFEHGPFKITFHESDHDTIGAAAIFIEAPDLKLVYSGDLRLSGFAPEKVLQWAAKAKEFQPDILLLEGTTFSSSGEDSEIEDPFADRTETWDLLSERALISRLDNLLTASDELIVFNGYPQNIERLVKLAELANKNNRQIVFDPAYYELAKPFVENTSIEVLKLNADITIESINQHPEKYIVQVEYENRQILSELKPGIYVHSNGMPIGPYMPEFAPFFEKVLELGYEVIFANVSGHAHQADLLMVAYAIQAKIVVPWHTFKPVAFGEALNEYGISTFLPEKKKEYTVSDIIK